MITEKNNIIDTFLNKLRESNIDNTTIQKISNQCKSNLELHEINIYCSEIYKYNGEIISGISIIYDEYEDSYGFMFGLTKTNKIIYDTLDYDLPNEIINDDNILYIKDIN